MLLNIYRGKKAGVLSTLTFNDATLWSADIFVGAILALFIVHNIDGGTAIEVGFAFAIYRTIRSLTAIPLGRYFDAHKGHTDEYVALGLSGLLVAGAYIGLFFSTEIWHVYLGMAVIGLGHTIDICSWKVLFYANVTDETRGEIVGVYETFMQIVYALSIAVAGFIGEIFGFEWIFFFAAILAFLSSFIMFLMSRRMKDF